MEEVVLIADPLSKSFGFAKGIYNYLKAKEGRNFSVKLVDLQVFNFKDGEFKVKIAENIRRKKCFLIFDSNKTPCRWMCELAFTLEAMTFSSPEEINVILPYTRFARQDKKDESRVSVNSRVLADIVSMYATRGMTVDLHAGQIQEYFNIPFDNLYSFTTLVDYLEKNHPRILDDLVIVSPDLGGGKRAEGLVKRLQQRGIKASVALGHKTREKDNEVAKIVVIGDVENKNCLIIDDIIDTGNTLIKTAEVLKAQGARNIYAYGTHGLFTCGIDKFQVFDKVLVSDSLQNIFLDDRFEIVPLIDLFGEAIYRTIVGESLSILFDGCIKQV